MSTAWLLEFQPPVGATQYYCAPGDWCTNPNHARKFAAKQEADDVHSSMQNRDLMYVVEHEWVSAEGKVASRE